MDSPDFSGDRWLIITDDDRRGKILVVAIICCIYCPMILALRAVGSLKNLGLNDYLMIAAILTAFIEYIAVFVGVSDGLGRTFDEIDAIDAGALGKTMIASEVFFFTALTLAKCSVIALCRRLFSIDMKRNLFVCDCVAVLCVAWGIGSVLAITISCSPAQQIGYRTAFCADLTSRWIGVAVSDAVLEVLLFCLATFVVYPLQMRKKRKLEVLASFAPRLIIIILIGLHAQAIHQQTQSRAFGVNLTDPAVYRQVLLICSVTTAAVPALNRSLRLFHSSMGANWMKTTTSQSGGRSTTKATSASDRKQSDIALQTLEAGTVGQQLGDNNDRISRLRPDQTEYSFTVQARASGDIDAHSGRSHGSTDSKAKIIRKEMHWDISHEDR